ncbi:MAG TPA: HAD-IB family phosphatase [Thermoplasmata archaeon]|nr:HAD-IB family phosphatase [Thermoplasmata archaeon]
MIPAVRPSVATGSPLAPGNGTRLQILLDFDGTLVEPNVAIVLVEKFCPDGERVAHEVDEELHAGRITLREAWARQVALLPAARLDEMTEFVVREIPLRRGAERLLKLLRDFQVPTAIVSGGLEFFIRPVLAREGLAYPLYADGLEQGTDSRLRVVHPYGHPTCRLCGICKANVTLGFATPPVSTVFIGDGSTDKYAAEVAEIVFARRRLKDYCARSGIPFFPFEDFDPVSDRLEGWLTGADSLPPPRPRGLLSSACPISQDLARQTGR